MKIMQTKVKGRGTVIKLGTTVGCKDKADGVRDRRKGADASEGRINVRK
jgi:hypothetical protein